MDMLSLYAIKTEVRGYEFVREWDGGTWKGIERGKEKGEMMELHFHFKK